MNWVPQYVDKPIVLLFTMDIWRIVLVLTYILLVATDIGQIPSLAVGIGVGLVIRKVEAAKPAGFIYHWYYRHLGWRIKGFPHRPGNNRKTRI